MPGLIALILALATLFFVLFVMNALGAAARKRQERVSERVQALTLAGPNVSAQDIVRRTVYSEVPWFHRLLADLRWTSKFERVIRQAKMTGTPGLYLLASAVLCAVAFVVVMLATGAPVAALVAAAILGPLPIVRVYRRRAARMANLQRQLPDALDLIARALKAGNTFAGGMRMVADEFHDPIGPEFAITLDEINFGMDVEKALHNLMDRVDSLDLKFFVVSVNIQRETGGNLSEIIGNTAALIRERFKIHGRIRILSAEGRISALVLLALPFAAAGMLYLIKPDYMSLLVTEPLGRLMIKSALVSMTMGYFVIRRMVNFKV
ncbi:MAG: type II secretion system F family protein [Humidesulfovibrio sp.]|uniref:type II secretion system F family protein n=1 Tax=Humidesulfovibrio sp. TaxID=2910988 RepID=UPI0027E7FC5C|nr:type II secretion system F family protein [Humidesulfovibrio sp.]MDQ7836654.1 type II secretion system F family protein [Humidesulfovibrio sp.]